MENKRLKYKNIICIVVFLISFIALFQKPLTFAEEVTPIPVNEEVTGHLKTKEDVNWYQFTLNAAGVFSVGFHCDYSDNSRWRIAIYDQEKNFITKFQDTSFATSSMAYGFEKGTYYIKVEAYDTSFSSWWSTKDYKIIVHYEKSDIWESEKNNTLKQADKIELDTKYHGNLFIEEDIDCYQFEIKKSGYFTVGFETEEIAEKSRWKITIFDADKKRIATLVDEGARTVASRRLGFEKGSYYIQVESYTTEAGRQWTSDKYELSVEYELCDNWESEYNDSFKKADPINVNKTYYGNMKTKEDKDYYKFKITEAGYFRVNFKEEESEAHSRFSISIYNSAKNLITTFEDYGLTSSTSIPLGYEKGTYYIQVKSYNTAMEGWWSEANYKLKVLVTKTPSWETEGNNSFKKADSIELSQKQGMIKGNIKSAKDMDYFKVYVEEDRKLKMIFSHTPVDNARWLLTLYDKNKEKIQTISNTSAKTSAYAAVKKGTYYIKIENGGMLYSNKTYKLKLR